MTDSRLRSSLAAYAGLTGATLWLGFDRSASAPHLVLFAALGTLKMLAGPLAVLLLAKRYGLPRDLAPSVNVAWRIAVVLACGLLAYRIGFMPPFTGISAASAVFFAMFASIATVVLHRNLLAHVIGMLVLGSAIGLAGAVFAPGLPGSVEVADTFDALLATLVALLVARAIVAYDPHLDIRSLRNLRG